MAPAPPEDTGRQRYWAAPRAFASTEATDTDSLLAAVDEVLRSGAST